MAEQTGTATPIQEMPIETKRAEDFSSLYANNVRFESSVWDLRILFGELDQSAEQGKHVVELHTAIAIPWVQVKLMIYYLQLNLFLHEAENGKVRIAQRVFPPDPGPMPPKEFENDPTAKALHELVVKLHRELVANQ
jgi:hypothetical protein